MAKSGEPTITGIEPCRFQHPVLGDVSGFRSVHSDGSRGPCAPLAESIGGGIVPGGIGGVPDAIGGAIGGLVPDIGGLVTRIAIGAFGAVLIIVGLVLIATDVGLSQAASRFGRSIGKVVKR